MSRICSRKYLSEARLDFRDSGHAAVPSTDSEASEMEEHRMLLCTLLTLLGLQDRPGSALLLVLVELLVILAGADVELVLGLWPYSVLCM